jgi:ABC-type uncharacterized transport system permease subunit
MNSTLLNVSALIALLPAMLQALRRLPSRDAVFWAVLAVATAAAVARTGIRLSGAWETGLASTLWVTIAATLVLYCAVAALTPQGWRLAPLLGVYMILLGAVASVWEETPGRPLTEASVASGWIGVHIAAAVVTYGLVTIAAVAALAAFVQEGALKRRRPTALTRMLPPVSDCEHLVVVLLSVGEAVLAFGLATGMAVHYRETGTLVGFDHKTVLTVAAFAVIGGLLIAHSASGVRGRRAARFVLLAYLLLTLGYPGVKFVSDVLMA